MSKRAKPFTFIDLFAGAGGLSEGFAQAGFHPAAHVELMQEACFTLRTRACFYELSKTPEGLAIYHSYLRKEITREELYSKVSSMALGSVICERLSEETLADVYENIDTQLRGLGVAKPDVIIGGPPCQAYSIVGRSRTDMSADPRNHLYKLYVKFLERYRPAVFVFENVAGIKSAGNGSYFADLKARCEQAGYRVQEKVLKAEDYGVLQKRRREIVVGIRTDYKNGKVAFEYPAPQTAIWGNYVVGDLLSDLATLRPGEERNEYITAPTPYLLKSGIRTDEDVLSWHLTRPIRPFDQQIYSFVIEYTKSHGRTPDYTELPKRLRTHKNTSSFLDRFKMVNPLAHATQTMVAHISKDGHYYIYPDSENPRSLSVREAARIQSFPDNYFFEGSRTSVFTQIGNAVPPLLARAIAESVMNLLTE